MAIALEIILHELVFWCGQVRLDMIEPGTVRCIAGTTESKYRVPGTGSTYRTAAAEAVFKLRDAMLAQKETHTSVYEFAKQLESESRQRKEPTV